jgi:RNA polymerase sigma-70 factor (ECF subfamily)
MATRSSLLARLKDWSQQTAWRQFDQDYTPLIRNFARKAGLTDSEASEVAQETLIAVAKKIEDFQHAGNRGSFRAWLYQQARWRIADQFRARAKAKPPGQRVPTEFENSEEGIPVSLDGSAVQSDSTFERLWDLEWEQHVRQSALARVKRQVSPRQYQLFELHVQQGLSVAQTAHAAGATVAAVYMAKSRVARLVKKAVKALNS